MVKRVQDGIVTSQAYEIVDTREYYSTIKCTKGSIVHLLFLHWIVEYPFR